MDQVFKVTHFRAQKTQALRNFKVHSPCIIQVLSGSKVLFQQSESRRITSKKYLLCSAATSLSFHNEPKDTAFRSRMFSFYTSPEKEMLALSKKNQGRYTSQKDTVNKPIELLLNTLDAYGQLSTSSDSQKYLVDGLYQILAERGELHILFPTGFTSFHQEVAYYLSQAPESEHLLESTAAYFALSRATFIRRLSAEKMRYRDLLADVRLNHALKLIQEGNTNIALLTRLCGYSSQSRFSQRFSKKFGTSLKEYIKTLSFD